MAMLCKGGGIPRPLGCNVRAVEIVAAADGTENASRRVGGGGCPSGQSEGVYGSNSVGDYRTMAFIVSVAHSPSHALQRDSPLL